MRILWITNVVFPYPSSKLNIGKNFSGGWLVGLLNELKKDKTLNIGIISFYNNDNFIEIVDDNIIYYMVPRSKFKNKIISYFNNIIEKFNPDLCHIHGTEYLEGLIFQENFPFVPNIVSIQGLVSIIANYYVSNIKYNDIRKNFTFRNLIKGNIITEQNKFMKKGKIEQKILNNASAIVGRTSWDYANCMMITNNKCNYYNCNENLRDSFYLKEWDLNKINKYSIFISQASYAIKGVHIALEALNYLKNIYPDIKLYISGPNIFELNSLIKKIKYSNYQRYLYSLIKKYDLFDYIEFVGVLNEKEYLEKLLTMNVYVQTSSIENSSNALGEAMLLGMPCVASNVGGTSDMLDYNEGYLYPFGDYGLLAYYIRQIFDNSDDFLIKCKNARKHAKITHDRIINCNRIKDIYIEVIKNNK